MCVIAPQEYNPYNKIITTTGKIQYCAVGGIGGYVQMCRRRRAYVRGDKVRRKLSPLGIAIVKICSVPRHHLSSYIIVATARRDQRSLLLSIMIIEREREREQIYIYIAEAPSEIYNYIN